METRVISRGHAHRVSRGQAVQGLLSWGQEKRAWQAEGRETLRKEEGGVVGPAELSSHGAFSLLGIVE